MSIETLPFEHRPRNSIANNLDKINELVDWANQDTHLYASASGERVTADDAYSVKGLTVDGRSVQDGTPTPDAPVQVQVVEGPLSLVIGDASVAINLQGNKLASLPDGTHDELHVDSAGHCMLTKNVGKTTIDDSLAFGSSFINSSAMGGNCTRITMNMSNFPTMKSAALNATNSYMSIAVAGSTSASTTPYPGVYSKILTSGVYLTLPSTLTSASDVTAWLTANNFDFFYPLAMPTTIDLGYIDPPAIPSGSVVTVSASLTPTFHLEWWVDDGITALINDLIAYVDYKTEG